MIKLKPHWASLAVAVSALGVFAYVTYADSAQGRNGFGFNERSIQGNWGYSNPAPALLLPPAAPEPTPLVGVGVIHFDGQGGCSVHAKVNAGGQTVDSESIYCDYTVEPDGRGDVIAQFTNTPIDAPFPVSFVIVNHATELRFINTEIMVGGFIAKRQ